MWKLMMELQCEREEGTVVEIDDSVVEVDVKM
jgi:hypothetical protein